MSFFKSLINLTFILFAVLFISQYCFGQSSPNVYLNYEQILPINCDNNEVCFNLQIKTDPDSTIEFYAINIRMFFDFAELEFKSYESPFGFFYNVDSVSVLGNNDVEIGFDEPFSLQYNLIGGFPNFLETLDSNYLNFAEICFTPQSPPDVGNIFCNSLVWDLKEDLSGGITYNTDGVTIIHYQNEASHQTQEHTSHLNWQYVSNDTGIKNQNTCITWPCNSNCSVTVLNNLNNGIGSLRSAINCAMNNDTILFSNDLMNDTIKLNTNPININKNLTIITNLDQNIYIKTNASYLFKTSISNTVIMENLRLIGGFGQSPAIILNNGELNLSNVDLFLGTATNPSSIFILNNGVINFSGNNNFTKDN